jgi:hypothetical protein
LTLLTFSAVDDQAGIKASTNLAAFVIDIETKCAGFAAEERRTIVSFDSSQRQHNKEESQHRKDLAVHSSFWLESTSQSFK